MSHMREISIFVSDDQSMFSMVLLFEAVKYNVVDVLPILRIIILRVTSEQLDVIQKSRGELWKKESLDSNRRMRR